MAEQFSDQQLDHIEVSGSKHAVDSNNNNIDDNNSNNGSYDNKFIIKLDMLLGLPGMAEVQCFKRCC